MIISPITAGRSSSLSGSKSYFFFFTLFFKRVFVVRRRWEKPSSYERLGTKKINGYLQKHLSARARREKSVRARVCVCAQCKRKQKHTQLPSNCQQRPTNEAGRRNENRQREGGKTAKNLTGISVRSFRCCTSLVHTCTNPEIRTFKRPPSTNPSIHLLISLLFEIRLALSSYVQGLTPHPHTHMRTDTVKYDLL